MVSPDIQNIIQSCMNTAAGRDFTGNGGSRRFDPSSFRNLIPLLALVVAAPFSLHAAAKPATKLSLDLPPRLQWNANYGYCGETSFISAGLYYGQYCSQYTARSLASPGIPQSRSHSQLLLGVNDVSAAKAMRLEASAWNTRRQTTSAQFLLWVKGQLIDGYPVIIGVFTNEFRFYNERNPSAGDPDYDHIVPVVGISSTKPLVANRSRYFGTDVLTFSDNGLWSPKGKPTYLFGSSFSAFPKNRRQANAKTAPIYSLNNNASNYGIAITGVADRDGDTIPVRLKTSVNSEKPEMKDGSNTPPAAGPLTVTATVSIPDPDETYTLYRYDNFAEVPESEFNAKAGNAVESWTIPANSGPTFTVSLPIQSNETVVFRAVSSSAP